MYYGWLEQPNRYQRCKMICILCLSIPSTSTHQIFSLEHKNKVHITTCNTISNTYPSVLWWVAVFHTLLVYHSVWQEASIKSSFPTSASHWCVSPVFCTFVFRLLYLAFRLEWCPPSQQNQYGCRAQVSCVQHLTLSTDTILAWYGAVCTVGRWYAAANNSNHVASSNVGIKISALFQKWCLYGLTTV